MRVVFEEEVRALVDATPPGVGRALTVLVDLPASPPLGRAAVAALRDDVLARVDARRAGQLDLVLFGAAPRAAPLSDLSRGVRRGCIRRGVGYTGHLISDGALLEGAGAAALARAGLTSLQIPLEGGRASWGGALAGFGATRGAAHLVLRLPAERAGPGLAGVVADLEGAVARWRDRDVTLYVAGRAPGAAQARDLAVLSALVGATDAGAAWPA